MKTPISYYGGKQMMTKELLARLPEHKIYVEAFAGGASLFWAKERAAREVINDFNGEVANFWRECRDNYDALKHLIYHTPHSREVGRETKAIYFAGQNANTPLARAWAFFVQTNGTFAKKIGSGWAFQRFGENSARTFDNKRENFTDAIKMRMHGVYIENSDAIKLVDFWDTPETFFYFDPPYFNSDCGHYKGYSQTDFENLLLRCESIKGKFLLSCYPSDVLSEFANRNGWKTETFEKKLTAAKNSNTRTKTEVLTRNY